MPTVLEMVEKGCSGSGKLRFLPNEADPRPISDLWKASEAAGKWLVSKAGERPVIAGVLSTSFASVASVLGTWRAGGTFASLPLPGRAMSPDAYVSQLTRVCKLIEASCLLVDPAYLSLFPDDMGLDIKPYGFDEVLSGRGEISLPDEGGWLVQFSSGSTSDPKGIRLSQEAIGANVVSIIERAAVVPGDKCCSWLPLSHDMGLIGMCLTALATGAPEIGNSDLTLISPEHFLARPTVWMETCSEMGASITCGPNFGLELALRRLKRSKPLDLSRMRVLITGAERVRPSTLHRVEEELGAFGFPKGAFCPAYGLAEATLCVSLSAPGREWKSVLADSKAMTEGRFEEMGVRSASDPEPHYGTEIIELVSCGSPISDMEFMVVAPGSSPASGKVPQGSTGEILVKGPSLLTDYIGAELSLAEGGWFETSDLGFERDGELYVVGRMDDLIIVAGKNFHAVDLEACVDNAAVKPGTLVAVATEDGRYAVVAEPSEAATADALPQAANEIRSQLSESAGTAPSSVIFVTPKSVPKTTSGKLQRYKVRMALESGQLSVESRSDFGAR